MELEIINKLFLELGQVAQAVTQREISIAMQRDRCIAALREIANECDSVSGEYTHAADIAIKALERK